MIAHALSALGDSQAIMPLVEQLQGIIETAENGVDSVDRSKYGETLLRILGSFADPAALPTVLEMAEISSQPRLQMFAAEALGRIGGSESLDTLLELLTNASALVRHAVAEALSLMADKRAIGPLMRALSSEEDDYTKSAIADALGTLQAQEAWPLLLNTLAKASTYSEHIATALMTIDKNRSIPALTEILQGSPQSGQTDLRLGILQALVQTKNPEMVQLLLTFLKSEPSKLQIRLINRLAKLQLLEAVPDLSALASNDQTESEIRCEAVMALGQMRAVDAVDTLIRLTDSTDTAVVARAIEALGDIGDARAIPKLKEMLYDERMGYYFFVYLYNWAEGALRKFDSPDVIAAINQAFQVRNKLDSVSN